MNAKIITDLLFSGAMDANMPPLAGKAWLCDQPKPGFIRRITLSPDGVGIQHGENIVVVPLPALIALAEKAQPLLVPPAEVPSADDLQSDGSPKTSETVES